MLTQISTQNNQKAARKQASAVTMDTSDALNTSTEKDTPLSEWNDVVTKKRHQKEIQKADIAQQLSSSESAPVKKQRGRPRKQPKTDVDGSSNEHDIEVAHSDEEQVSGGRSEQTQDTSFFLTKKKQQYLVQAIEDKTGKYEFQENPEMYKKARKRLQNRESAVRSRMKKREELDVLEAQVRALEQEKAAFLSENASLKKANEYFQDLFSKQTLGGTYQAPVEKKEEVETLKVEQPPQLEKQNSLDACLEEIPMPSDPLEMSVNSFLKRQKRSDSMETDSAFFTNKSSKGDASSLASEPISNLHNYAEREQSLNVEDFILSRGSNDNTYESSFGNGSFLGLGLVCCLLGVVSTTASHHAATTESSIGSSISSGHRLKEANRVAGSCESDSLDFENCGEEPTMRDHFNSLAMMVFQSLMTVPVITYIFFGLALVSFVTFLRPAFLFGSPISSRKLRIPKTMVHEEVAKSRKSKKKRSSKGKTQE